MQMQLTGKKRVMSGFTDKVSQNSTFNEDIYNKYTGKPYSKKYYEILAKRKTLPAWESKNELFELLGENQVVILKGETGSGKTTQIPQFLLEKYSCIAITQPRRVAAMSVAKRVSEEMDVTLGQQVGYSIRFEDCSNQNTLLKYMTDGMLLKEAMTDYLLRKYDLIILDECHERTLATEILFGLMKEILPKRPDLKLVVMSATIDIQKFKDFFEAPVLSVPGRLYKVDIKYLPDPCQDYLEEAVDIAVKIHENENEGDILIFLTGEEEIENACAKLYERIDEEESGYVSIIPLYSTLPPHQQQKIFENAPGKNKKGRPGRKIVVSTNIAETSITIDGVVYVIDSGFSKQKVYNPRLRMDSLLVSPISKASAKQRAGRAGRTREGICYRLYTKETYENDLEKTCYPEILRSNLSTVILTLLKIGIKDIVHFDFMDPPAPETMMRALEMLHHMGAINDEPSLTEDGKVMAYLPLDPELSKVLISSKDYKCINEILTIVSMLSVPGVFVRPRQQQSAADDAKKQFIHSSGDHLTLLFTYNIYKSKENSEAFCKHNFLNVRNLKNAESIRNQLETLLSTYGIEAPENKYSIDISEKKVKRIMKALLSGCFAQVCHLEPQGCYRTVKDNQLVLLHPSTVLTFKPSWVLYFDFVCTGKNYIRTVSKIDPTILFEVAPQYYNLHDFDKGSIKNDLKKVLNKLKNEENAEQIEEKEESKKETIRELNKQIVDENKNYSKYSTINKYSLTNQKK